MKRKDTEDHFDEASDIVDHEDRPRLSTRSESEVFSDERERSKWKRILDVIQDRTNKADHYAVQRSEIDLKQREEDVQKTRAETKNLTADATLKIEEARRQRVETIIKLLENDQFLEMSPEAQEKLFALLELDDERVARGIDLRVVEVDRSRED